MTTRDLPADQRDRASNSTGGHAYPQDLSERGTITAILFIGGRYVITFYLTYAAPASTYGAAGSLVLILLWVYYSSLILFFGSALTKARLLASGKAVVPRAMAVRVRKEIVEEDLA